MDFEVYPYSFDRNNVSVIEIPWSANKPHIIKEYESIKGTQTKMFIPIRKGTSINPASKYDLDHIYFEKNRRVVVDYGLDIILPDIINANSYGGNDSQSDYYTQFGIPATIINKGLNVNSITQGRLILDSLEDHSPEISWPLYKFTFLRETLIFKIFFFFKDTK